jgi:integrase
MASLRRKPNSRFWIACFTDQNSAQRQVSTKELNRAKAQKIAEKFETTYRIKLTEAQARKVVSDIYEEIRGDKLYHATTRAFLSGWLESKKTETAAGTHKRYENAVDKLLAFLGDRADRDIAYVDKKDLVTLRDTTATGLSPSTANTDLKILRIAFGQAVNDGLRLDNPAKAVKALKSRREPGEPERRPFTEAELKQLFTVLSGEWRGITLTGLYTGQRLGDIALLPWKAVDFEQRCITFHPQKTETAKGRRTVIVPIAEPLLAWLKEANKHAKTGPVFPTASQEKIDSDGESRRQSAQFHALLVKAGLATKRSKKNTGRGHSVKRTVSELSFHSLRHTTTSMLKKAGVPEAVVRDIIGHESALVSRGYTHIDEAAKRRAVQKLPDIS